LLILLVWEWEWGIFRRNQNLRSTRSVIKK
jgi:hypothetical protein